MTTLTNNSRQREQQIQSLIVQRVSLRHERRLSREISSTMRKAAKLVKQNISPNELFNEHKNKIESIMNSLYVDTIEAFAKYFTGTEKARNHFLVQKKAPPTTPIIDEIISGWLQSNGGRLITEISETTMTQINDIVAQGVRDGLSEKEIATMIEDIAPLKAGSRAATIARTESHRAANVTGYQTAKATGLEMLKVWVPSGGGRTRDAHRQAGIRYKDGIGLDDFFIVDGERMRYPSDPSGSASNTINCRCALVYEFV